MATVAAERIGNDTDRSWAPAFQSYEGLSGTESRAAVYSGAETLFAWRAGSEYIKGLTPMPTSPCMEVSPYLDMARRRAIWKGVTPLAFLFAIVSGIATTSAGLPVMICVMAGVFVVTATIGRVVWPS